MTHQRNAGYNDAEESVVSTSMVYVMTSWFLLFNIKRERQAEMEQCTPGFRLFIVCPAEHWDSLWCHSLISSCRSHVVLMFVEDNDLTLLFDENQKSQVLVHLTESSKVCLTSGGSHAHTVQVHSAALLNSKCITTFEIWLKERVFDLA